MHPGYGFLSEDRLSPLLWKKEGVAFIGPPVKTIEAMGDKDHLKLAAKAGVSTVPGPWA